MNKIRVSSYFILVSLMLFSFPCLSQKKHDHKNKKDSIYLKEGAKIVFFDTTIIIASDTVIARSDPAILKVKKRFFRRVFDNYLMIERDTSQSAYSVHNISSEHLEGKTVGQISLKKIDVFGTSIQNPEYKKTTPFYRFINKLHIKTQDRILRRSMPLREGDVLNAYSLRDNERVLRQLDYIKDIRILPILRPDRPDSIDLLVLEKDVWAWDFDFIPIDINAADFVVRNINFLGLGHFLEFQLKLDFDLEQSAGYFLGYGINNIFGPFTKVRSYYSNIEDLEEFNFSLDKRFQIPEVKFAGGLYYSAQNSVDSLYYDYTDIERVAVGKHQVIGWVGRSFLLKKGNQAKGHRMNVALSISNETVNYFKRPDPENPDYMFYQNSNRTLAGIGITWRRYFVDSYVSGFGITEDISSGIRLELIAGGEIGEFYNRPYAGTRMAYGIGKTASAYYGGIFEAGTFIHDNQAEQGAINVVQIFYTPLIKPQKKWRQRFYIKAGYNLGINPLANTTLDIARPSTQSPLESTWLRGLGSDMVKGNTSLVANLNHVLFSPWRVGGFRLAFFGFGDLGYISETRKVDLSITPYYGLGAGFLINNEDLIFGPIQFSAGFYPNTPDDASFFVLGFGIRGNVKPTGLELTRPAIIPFGEQ